MTEDLTVEITVGESSDSIDVPAGLVDILAEGDPSATAVADVTLFALTQRAHALAHHSEADLDADLDTIESRAMELFEERFGASYEEITGHSH
jgi:hypothetical protein